LLRHLKTHKTDECTDTVGTFEKQESLDKSPGLIFEVVDKTLEANRSTLSLECIHRSPIWELATDAPLKLKSFDNSTFIKILSFLSDFLWAPLPSTHLAVHENFLLV
jgi:hypothetical protein